MRQRMGVEHCEGRGGVSEREETRSEGTHDPFSNSLSSVGVHTFG
jgi:hypothetical protein